MLPILTSLALVAAPQTVDPVGSIQRLDVPTDPTGTVTIPVELDGKSVNMVLDRYSIRAADFRLFGTRPDGVEVQLPAPQANTYRGEIAGWADSIITATINGEGLTAVVTDLSSEVEWQIQPAEGYDADTYSVARASDLVAPPGVCGTNGIVPPTSVTGGGITANGSSRGTGWQLCEIALDADWEFYNANGQSAQATLDDMERVINRVSAIYERDCDVSFQITGVVIRTNSNDPYTSSDAGTRLDQFRSHWNSNFAGVRKDIAHLFTGVNLNGGTIGVAYLGVVCNQSLNYGLSESRFTGGIVARTGLTAHEIGHNFNSGHCDGNGDCRIMCSGLGGCQGDVSRFGNSVANGIRQYAINRGCLLDLSPPLALPVIDTFPSTNLNRDIWISFQGTTINTAASNEPSAPNSIELDALNANALRDDVLISNKILLGSSANAAVSVKTQHSGVPSGGTLRVEILDSSNDWQLLTLVTSDGSNQTQFETHTALVPAGALHDEAQVRITVDVDGPSENWFLDDFQVTEDCVGSISQYCLGFPNSVSFLGADLSGAGSTSIADNNMVFNVIRCPANSFGIYIYADGQTSTALADGLLCVQGSPIWRLAVVQNDAMGNSSYNLDLNNLAPGSTINPGETWNFQLWYRDSTANGANLTNGLEIRFCD